MVAREPAQRQPRRLFLMARQPFPTASTAFDFDAPVRRGQLAPAGSAMGDLGRFVGRRRKHTIRRLEQPIVGPLAAEQAVCRGKPVRQARAIFGRPEHGQDRCKRLQGPAARLDVQAAGRRPVKALVGDGNDLPFLLPFIATARDLTLRRIDRPQALSAGRGGWRKRLAYRQSGLTRS